MPFESHVIQDTTQGSPSSPSFKLQWRDMSSNLYKNFSASQGTTVKFNSSFMVTQVTDSNSGGTHSHGGAAFRLCNTNAGKGIQISVFASGQASGSTTGPFKLAIGQATDFGGSNDTPPAIVTNTNIGVVANTWYRMEITQTTNSSGLSTITAVVKNLSGSVLSTLSTSLTYTRGDYCGYSSVLNGQHDTLLSMWADNITVQVY